MDDFSNFDPTALVSSTYLQLELIKRKVRMLKKESADAQAKRENAFGRHLKEEAICGIRCYPELILECAQLSTWMEAVGAYNEAVARYEGNCDATLSVKQFRKIANELAKD